MQFGVFTSRLETRLFGFMPAKTSDFRVLGLGLGVLAFGLWVLAVVFRVELTRKSKTSKAPQNIIWQPIPKPQSQTLSTESGQGKH